MYNGTVRRSPLTYTNKTYPQATLTYLGYQMYNGTVRPSHTHARNDTPLTRPTATSYCRTAAALL